MITMWENVKAVAAIIAAAEQAASECGSERVCLEHLVMGALALPDESARALLAAHGCEADRFVDAVVSAEQQALAGLGLSAARPSRRIVPRPTGPATNFEAPARAVLHRTRELARASTDGRLRSAHVVMAAAAEPSGATARAFALLGVDTGRLSAGS